MPHFDDVDLFIAREVREIFDMYGPYALDMDDTLDERLDGYIECPVPLDLIDDGEDLPRIEKLAATYGVSVHYLLTEYGGGTHEEIRTIGNLAFEMLWAPRKMTWSRHAMKREDFAETTGAIDRPREQRLRLRAKEKGIDLSFSPWEVHWSARGERNRSVRFLGAAGDYDSLERYLKDGFPYPNDDDRRERKAKLLAPMVGLTFAKDEYGYVITDLDAGRVAAAVDMDRAEDVFRELEWLKETDD
jgi:hypothetical protein